MIQIPIKNLYYLIAYACKILDVKCLTPISNQKIDTPLNLLADLYLRSVKSVFNNGIYREYHNRSSVGAPVRGKIDLNTSIKTGELASKRLYFEEDELTHDILLNKILKSTGQLLIGCEIVPKIRRQIVKILANFCGVSDVKQIEKEIRRVRLNRNSRYYKSALAICSLCARNLFVNPDHFTSRQDNL